MRTSGPLLSLCFLALAGCQSSTPSPDPSVTTASATSPVATAPAAQRVTASAAQPVAPASTAQPTTTAPIGAPAPDFELTDLDGKKHKLSNYKGKRVVLEWFNPECPFVKASHGKGSLKEYARKATAQGVVWLAINSGGAGKQGHGVEVNRKGKETFKLDHPILIDEDGKVGKSYGAQRTPHLFVVDEKGLLVYRGAIDNSPDGEGESPQGGKLINHVEQALADLAAKRPVQVPETKAYGCGVKYL